LQVGLGGVLKRGWVEMGRACAWFLAAVKSVLCMTEVCPKGRRVEAQGGTRKERKRRRRGKKRRRGGMVVAADVGTVPPGRKTTTPSEECSQGLRMVGVGCARACGVASESSRPTNSWPA